MSARARHASSPVVIFGTGGSGTRAVAWIVAHAGYFLGARLNESADSLDLAEFLERRIDAYLARVPWIPDVLNGAEVTTKPGSVSDDAVTIADFHAALARHRQGIPREDSPWGWKNPRSIFLLPFFCGQYPEMRVIHVVRDGRDIAYSANQNQLVKHGAQVLPEVDRRGPEPRRAMLLWTRLNLAAARYGRRHLGERYRRVCLEELCADPARGVERLFEFVGGGAAGDTGRAAAVAAVASPSSLGRWRSRDAAEVRSLTEVGEPALREFGYV